MRILWILVALCSLAAAQAPARVEGRVVSTTGEPVRKATVRLVLNGQPPKAYIELTGSDGRFLFEGVAPGRYSISAQKAGYGPASTAGTGSALVFEGGEARRGVEIRMTPASVVSGRLTDPDGDPVQGAQVQLMRRGYARGRRTLQYAVSAQTDDRGQYRITNVQPGHYYVLASDPAARTFGVNPNEIRGLSALEANLATYFPNSPDVGGSLLVYVGAGAEVDNLDIRMRRGRTYSVHGVAVDESGAPVQAQLTLYQASAEGPSPNTQTTARPGT